MTDNDVKFPSSFSKGGKPTKKELLRQLLDLEDDNLGNNCPPLGKVESKNENENSNDESINDVANGTGGGSEITKPKKQLTEKQLEALKKGQATRDANIKKRKDEAMLIAAEEKKKLEEKIVRKAISIKKQQIKKQSALDEIEDDQTPIQKIKEIASTFDKSGAKAEPKLAKTIEPIKQKINFF
jgi:hypothetical protein